MTISKRTAPDVCNAARPEWTTAQRIVVKIGSSLLSDKDTGALKSDWLKSLMDDVAATGVSEASAAFAASA